MTLSERVLRTVRQHALLPPGGRVAVALSGGADSVALVHILRDLETPGEVRVVGLAHFNHQLRGAESDEDESFCRSMAATLGLRLEVGRADVRQLAREQGRSIEDAARGVRYAFLEEAADRLGADVVAVAHSRDDQAETFLLRLIRGSGPRGLAGILPRAGRIVRPLLDISRADLRQYAAERTLAFRDDSSNADLAIPRNRVRHELLPYLEREFSPGIASVLAREAAIAREDEDRLQTEAIDLAGRIVLTDTKPAGPGDSGSAAGRLDRVEIEVAALRSLHPALGARVARIGLSVLAPRRFIGSDHVERFLRFAREARPGAALSLPGQQAVRHGNRVVLGPEPPRGPRAVANSFRFPLSIPGEVTIDRSRLDGWAITAEALDPAGWSGESWPARGPAVAVAAPLLSLPLAIRQRRAGDRFRPMGLGGRGRKLQDFLVDRKIPRELRDLLPLVVDGDDRIVWVVGESASEDFRVTDPAQGVILLKVRRLGGPG
jgi:tRNA(Ile)-lysidine synthase